MSDPLDLDRQFVWHPYTQHATERPPTLIARSEGAFLFDAEGREILDLISSWWTCLHGHSHSALNEALIKQVQTLDHVMFSGFTHLPAVTLAERLAEILPGDLNRVFYSDNGSTAVEVALKLAYQYWQNQGQSSRTGFIAFESGYHGDTLGAMSAGRGSGFFTLFQNLMCPVCLVPFASTFDGDDAIEEKEQVALRSLKSLLHENGKGLAAIILEPLMQGAGGMRFCRPEFAAAVVELARDEGLLVIYDEVATGFGRTGSMFALEQVGLEPDIICLSKGLTAGYMPMSVTVAKERLFLAFLGESFTSALAHGHSFTGNPLACAIALRSLELFDEENTLSKISRISVRHQEFSDGLRTHDLVGRARVLGSVFACDLTSGGGTYKSEESLFLRDWYLEHGLNIRPIGSTLYLMPPYCITDSELEKAYRGLLDGLEALKRRSS